MLRNIAVLLVILGTLALIGFLIIITPDNALVGLFRTSLTANPQDKVIAGPYPVERDFRALQTNGVTTIVSLLNPDIYYEDVLLNKEREMAEKYGMKFLNFPMGSILGQHFGANYEANATAAARAATGAPGKVYVHCYLGMHRIKSVLALLSQQPGVETGTYALHQGERDRADQSTDDAEAAFNAGDYDRAIALLNSIGNLNPAQRLLRGWSHYRKGEIDQAREDFMTVRNKDYGNGDAISGLGFCALRQGKVSSAENFFAMATQAKPNDPQAWTGLGLAHFRQGQLVMARQDLEKAVKLDPNNVDALEVLNKLKEPAK